MPLRSIAALRFAFSLWASLLASFVSTAALAIDWPQEVSAEEGTITVYQPQPEALTGNLLTGRAAMSLDLKGNDETIFGAFWFEATLDTDQDAGTALIRDLRVTRVRWPDSKDAAEQRFTAIVESALPENGFTISLDRLSASLESAQVEQKSLDNLKHEPPAVLFRDTPAVLLSYDGKPRYGDIDNSPYQRILNTPLAVVRRKGSSEYWLTSGTFWYRAGDPMGPWQSTSSPPADLAAMVQAAETDDSQPQPDSPPEIVTADQPTELIVTQGKPAWQSLPGGKVLFVENTESPWLRDLGTNNMYLLLSGRWYRSKQQDGPWTFVPADQLPPAFADIPPDSDIGGLRSSVAGTEEADNAVLDAQIPQTAAIKRDEVTLSVQYDGKPEFSKIPGTDVSYAVNTGSQVLAIHNRYYAVDNGVWFTASAATGPWQVADSIPEAEIQKIPPSSPVYNTTYVHVYESTPEVVYVGYLPGYLWSFPYYGVPVYGTGWYYPPYFGSYYYPRPATWGFNVGYNPWTGWSFGLSYSNGFFNFGIGWGGGYPGGYRPWGCCNGWYGGGYRGPVIINTGNINIGNNVNVGNRANLGNRIDRGGKVNIGNARQNIYNNGANRQRVADRSTAMAQLKQARPVNNRANNVYADRDGNVARKVQDGWESRNNGQWSKPQFSDSQRQSAQDALQKHQQMQRPAIDRSSLDRSALARQRGLNREMARPQMGDRGGLRRR
ncbi:carbohydrate-binding family V/XII [Haliea sp. E17]|uniref:carbohydrate-binding family V/XII n=1 Tax=Haliea sp. E17 TaxID=3401576 RepID=UPI003AAB7183